MAFSNEKYKVKITDECIEEIEFLFPIFFLIEKIIYKSFTFSLVKI